MQHVVALCFVVYLAACGHAPTRAADVTLTDETPTTRCDEIGEVEGRAATGPLSLREASQDAERTLRDAAARRGATHVRITRREEPGTTTVVLAGTAYRCASR